MKRFISIFLAVLFVCAMFTSCAKDEANNVATITVKGNDYDVNPSSKTVYTIKFDGTVGINGITTSTNSANGAIYDLSGRQLKTMQKGINIIRGKDGKMIKVMK